MAVLRVFFILVISILLTSRIYAEDTIIVKHYQQHPRYEFGLKVLDLALSKLEQNYQIVGPQTQELNQARGELLVIDGQFDLQFISTTLHRESSMIPVRIPIYQGLLGLRLLLVKPELNAEIKNITSLDELRKFVGGHGAHWGDLPVYAENKLKVVTSVSYDNLFEMLKKERFDYFHRGVNEIWNELEHYPNDFVVADNIMLFYPHPVYFFVGKHRPELAEQIERGMRIAIADGSYQTLFLQYHEKDIMRAKLDDRRLIILKNPAVPADTPIIRKDWWMPPSKMSLSQTP